MVLTSYTEKRHSLSAYDWRCKKIFTNFLSNAGTPSSATMVEWYRTSGSTPVSLEKKKQYRVIIQ